MPLFWMAYMNNRVVKNASWMIGARIFQMFLGLFISSWTVRYLGPDNMGIIGYIDAFVSFSGAVAFLGINNIIVKELIDHKEEQGTVLETALTLRICASAVCAVLVTILIGFLNPNNHLMIVISCILFTAQMFYSFEIFNYWYHSQLKSKVPSIIQTITYVLMAVYKIICLSLHKNVVWFAFANALEPILSAVMLLISYHINGKDAGRLRFRFSFAKAMLSKSYHFIFSGLMISIYGEIDRIMIKEFLDTTATGYYGTALGINTMWSFILAAIIESFYPTIIEAHKDNNKALYHQRIVQLYSVVFWFSAFASFVERGHRSAPLTSSPAMQSVSAPL